MTCFRCWVTNSDSLKDLDRGAALREGLVMYFSPRSCFMWIGMYLHLHLCSMWSQWVPEHFRRCFDRSQSVLTAFRMHLHLYFEVIKRYPIVIRLQKRFNVGCQRVQWYYSLLLPSSVTWTSRETLGERGVEAESLADVPQAKIWSSRYILLCSLYCSKGDVMIKSVE